MNKYTAQAQTVAEAIEKALKELDISKEDADIQVLEKGKKGFLGFGQKDAVVSASRIKPRAIKEKYVPQTDLNLDTAKKTNKKEAVVEKKEKLQQSPKAIPQELDKSKEVENNKKEETVLKNETAIQRAADYIQEIATHMGAAPVQVYVKQEGVRITFTVDTEKAGIVIGRHGKVLNAIQSLVQVMLHKEASSKLIATVDIEDYRDRRAEALQKLAQRTAERVLRTKRPVTLEPMPAHERKLIHHYLHKHSSVSTHSEGKDPHRYLVISLPKNKE